MGSKMGQAGSKDHEEAVEAADTIKVGVKIKGLTKKAAPHVADGQQHHHKHGGKLLDSLPSPPSAVIFLQNLILRDGTMELPSGVQPAFQGQVVNIYVMRMMCTLISRRRVMSIACSSFRISDIASDVQKHMVMF